MKKVISLILVSVMFLSTFLFNVTAADEEIDINDMFEYDFELTDEQIAYYVEESGYNPDTPSSPYNYIFYVYGNVYVNDPYYNPFYSGDGFETLEELQDYFHEWCEIKREYFEKYLIIDPTFFEVEEGSNGNYLSIGYRIFVRYELIDITNTYSSYDRASFYAKLYYALTGKYRCETIDLFIGVPENYYYKFDDSYSKDVDFGTETNTYTTSVLPYDANFDGSINARDVMILRKAVMGNEVKCNYYTRDLNGDKVTNAKDVLYLKKFMLTGEDLRN